MVGSFDGFTNKGNISCSNRSRSWMTNRFRVVLQVIMVWFRILEITVSRWSKRYSLYFLYVVIGSKMFEWTYCFIFLKLPLVRWIFIGDWDGLAGQLWVLGIFERISSKGEWFASICCEASESSKLARKGVWEREGGVICRGVNDFSWDSSCDEALSTKIDWKTNLIVGNITWVTLIGQIVVSNIRETRNKIFLRIEGMLMEWVKSWC